MKNLILILSAILILSSCNNRKKEGWIDLFNGKNLEGWTPKFTGYDLGENYKNTFRVEDGLLKVRYDEYEKWGKEFGHLFFKNPYSHYKLHVEYRVVGRQVEGGPGWAYKNNGLMLHCQSPQSMEVDQDFPTSIEVQLLGGAKQGDRPTLNLCTPGCHVVLNGKLHTQHCTDSKAPTIRDDQWVSVDIEVYGDSLIKHIYNGEVVLEYSKPQYDESTNKAGQPIDHGYISIQAESHPFDFRKIELLNLGDDCFEEE